MAEQATFGRRSAQGQPAPRPARDAEQLSPQAEAFLAAMGDGQGDEVAAFSQWRRAQQPRRLLLIAVGAAFVAPGLLCFVFQAPWWVSIGLSVAGVGVNGWLRSERQRQAREIAAWTPPS
ncbi:MAG TPA: hypothetical protein VG960_09235 [Caulobacteraceae bacterium]|nr:hypothetical protein [Caulobacteraceae bacterium]